MAILKGFFWAEKLDSQMNCMGCLDDGYILFLDMGCPGSLNITF